MTSLLPASWEAIKVHAYCFSVAECQLAFEWIIAAVKAVTLETTIVRLNYLKHHHEKKYL
ncbi:unnamed protein product [Gulo gulo]|uniref:Uncharacterized protein n=1 Tax=Gulo gulo TaxID=48420 RepID=A0A9X9M5A8_GULGU|nr:unnamed protein product [Gulo gulo]